MRKRQQKQRKQTPGKETAQENSKKKERNKDKRGKYRKSELYYVKMRGTNNVKPRRKNRRIQEAKTREWRKHGVKVKQENRTEERNIYLEINVELSKQCTVNTGVAAAYVITSLRKRQTLLLHQKACV